MKYLFKIVDDTSERIGKTASMLGAFLVLLMVFEVIMRYVFNAPTAWSYETSMMLGCTMGVIGWSYAHRLHAHIRVDVFYSRLSPRKRAIVNVVGTLVFFIPLMIVFIDTAINFAWRAWVTSESMAVGTWYPPLAPLRTIVVLSCIWFAIQGLVELCRDLYFVARNQKYD